MINKLRIKGFKSINQAEVELKSINVFIGANGVGKSNFMLFFHLLNNIYEKRLEYYSMIKGADKLLHFGPKNTDNIEGGIEFNHEKEYKFSLVPIDENKLNIKSELVSYNDSIVDKVDYFEKGMSIDNFLGASDKESLLKEKGMENSPIYSCIKNYFEDFKIYHFHDTTNNASIRTPCSINNNVRLMGDGGNIAAILYYLQEKHNKHFQIIESIIKSTASYFGGFKLRPDRFNEERINLEWYEKNNPDFIFNVKQLSDGTLRFIALTTLLMQPSPPRVIIIDEPELGLHPVAVYKLAGMIRSVSYNCQIIVATQSVHLVSQFDPNDVLTVDRVNFQTVFNRLNSEELDDWLSDFSLGDLWQKNIIKGQPY